MNRVYCTNCEREGHATWQCTRPKKSGSAVQASGGTSTAVEFESLPLSAEGLASPAKGRDADTANTKDAPNIGQAQKVERRSPKPKAAGSIPATGAKPPSHIEEVQPASQEGPSSILGGGASFAESPNGRATDFDSVCVGSTPASASKAKFDKVAYQREYMRNVYRPSVRARKKASAEGRE